ncbi:MAG TPA: tRNA lysidine(34) synthetase TilS [Candidatus Saccharimonadales bacterium]|nr:tRNA lysidine(34) synthetase TilS [Candidatus Saccharimonadales bacterium]
MSNKPTLIVAVSGGVDSMVMLDKLIKDGDYHLVVAHVNHGIRIDSDEDEVLVRSFAAKHGLSFESIKLNLGPGTSEQIARRARHDFLSEVKQKYKAEVIATAHHLDDVVETIILNFLRGTGWRGLCSLRSTAVIQRPLIDMRKSEVIAYAVDHRLAWREDSTNDDLKYTRNLIRNLYLPRLNRQQFNRLVELWRHQCRLRLDIDELVEPLFGADFDRRWLELDDALVVELLRAWLGRNYQAATFARLITFARTAQPGKKFNLPADEMILAKRDKLVDIGRR